MNTNMRVAIVHNAVTKHSAPDELDVLDQAEAVATALQELAHKTSLHACDLDLGILKHALINESPDIIFNLVESLESDGRLIHLAPAMFDTLGIPYTGSPSESLLLTSHKLIAKRIMTAAGLPTPTWYNLNSASSSERDQPHLLRGKVILKSLWEHASLGMSDNAVREISNVAELDTLLTEWAPKLGGACFAEQYIEGREFNISLLGAEDGPQLLPPAEIRFPDYPPGKPKIVGYDAKWHEDAFEYTGTPRSYDFERSDEPLLEKLAALSMQCWRIFGLRGYARVDFRVDSEGAPWILEVNANPCLSPDAGFAAACEQADISYRDMIQRILYLAG